MKMPIVIHKTATPKVKPAKENLGFGNHFTDHMFVMEYSEGAGWHSPRIEPYGPVLFEPSIMAFHYGQAVFEGMKAYKTSSEEVLLFRPFQNLERLNRSNHRMCIPSFDSEFVISAIKQLVLLDQDWIPTGEGYSLYIRPLIIATDPMLGVRPSSSYKMFVMLSPVGLYYPEGLNPVKIYVEPEYVRAVKGGVGDAKTAGNYAASLRAQMHAKQKGYTQVLWLDAIEKKYVEEVGTMNVFFKINNEIITPPLEGSILPGVTRDSVIQLLQHWKLPIVERRITIEEALQSCENGSLQEAFGTGTAAIISPIGELSYKDKTIQIQHGNIGHLSAKLYQTITDIQFGKINDPFGWIVRL